MRRFLGRLVGLVLRGLTSSLRWRRLGEDRIGRLVERGEPVALALWHGRSLLLLPAMRHLPCTALVSRSADGDWAAALVEGLGYGVVRGSSSRSGASGLRQMLRQAASGRLPAITVDGPRGPAGRVAPGIVGLSQLGRLWIVPLAASSARGRWLGSWDRTRIPGLGGRAVLLVGRPVRIDRSEARQEGRTLLEARLTDLHRRADRLCGVLS